MNNPSQTVHLCLLKRVLGVKRIGLSCGNVDMNLYSFIGSMQQLGFTMLHYAATALHSGHTSACNRCDQGGIQDEKPCSFILAILWNS
eukprot:1151149-Pelagomonas_calceolata.AAC.1